MKVVLALWRAAGSIAAVCVLVTVGACSQSQPEVLPEQRAGLGCVDDSKHCIDQRQSTLKSMMADRDRKWVREGATPQAYASGVRLFAFKSRKKELSCEELAIGRREAEAGPSALRGPGGGGLSPAQVSRGVMLAGEVGKELGVEMQRRCRA